MQMYHILGGKKRNVISIAIATKQHFIVREKHKSIYLDRCRETTRVLRRCYYQRINVRLSQILKIQFFRKFHDSRSRPDVECTCGSLTLCLQRVTYLPIGERLGFHRYYAEKFQHVTFARTSREEK